MKSLRLLFLATLAACITLHAEPVAPTLKNDLVSLNGKKLKRFDDTKLANTKYFGVYFSAHWCGPCRQFTPELVKWYNATKPTSPQFELIFVSNDHSEKDMEGYMSEAQMPWPALKYSKIKNNKTLTKLAGSGIPCLVLIDADGKILSNSYEGKQYVGPNKVMGDIDKLLKEEPAK